MPPSGTQTRLGLRSVYRQSLNLLGRNMPAILVLVIVIGWLPRLAIAQLHLHWVSPLNWDTAAWLTEVAFACLRLFLSQLLMVCVMHAVLTNSDSLAGSLGDTAKAVSRRLLQLAPLTLILDWPTLLSTLAKVQYSPLFLGAGAPAQNMVWYTALWSMVAFFASVWIILWVGVAGTVFIEETRPVASTLVRAARLLSGQRLRFFIIWLPYTLFETVLIMALTVPPIVFHASIVATAERQFALTSLVTSLSGAGWATLIAVSYRELRRLKDGSTVEIAEVFD